MEATQDKTRRLCVREGTLPFVKLTLDLSAGLTLQQLKAVAAVLLKSCRITWEMGNVTASGLPVRCVEGWKSRPIHL